MNDDRLREQEIRELAGHWYACAQGALHDAAVRAEFERWLGSDPRHRLAYAEVCAVAYALEQFEAEPVHATPAPSRRVAARPHRARVGGVALSLLLLVVAWQGTRPWDRLRSDLHTAEGEVREFVLADGSRAWLAGDSALALDYSAATRGIRLLRGEAHFAVEPDTARPFVVKAGTTTATALGTRYAVSHRGAGAVTVEVEEGRVAVHAGEISVGTLTASQQMHIDGNGVAGPSVALDSGALEWRQGLLVFDETPLAEAVVRLDAYVPGRVVLLGAVGTRRISAAIALSDASASLAAIAAREGLKVDGVPGVMMVLH